MPPLIAVNKVITQSLDFLRCTIGGDSFQNEIIIRLIIETTEKRLFPEKLPESIAVVVNDGVFSGQLVLEYEQPVILKDCYSQSKIKRLSMTADITSLMAE